MVGKGTADDGGGRRERRGARNGFLSPRPWGPLVFPWTPQRAGLAYWHLRIHDCRRYSVGTSKGFSHRRVLSVPIRLLREILLQHLLGPLQGRQSLAPPLFPEHPVPCSSRMRGKVALSAKLTLVAPPTRVPLPGTLPTPCFCIQMSFYSYRIQMLSPHLESPSPSLSLNS